MAGVTVARLRRATAVTELPFAPFGERLGQLHGSSIVGGEAGGEVGGAFGKRCQMRQPANTTHHPSCDFTGLRRWAQGPLGPWR